MPIHKFSAPGRRFTGACTIELDAEVGIPPLSNSGNCSICVTPVIAPEPVSDLVLVVSIISVIPAFGIGGLVRLNLSLTNNGSDTIEGITPQGTRPLFSVSGVPVSLAPGASTDLTGTYPIMAEDVANPPLVLSLFFQGTLQASGEMIDSNTGSQEIS